MNESDEFFALLALGLLGSLMLVILSAAWFYIEIEVNKRMSEMKKHRRRFERVLRRLEFRARLEEERRTAAAQSESLVRAVPATEDLPPTYENVMAEEETRRKEFSEHLPGYEEAVASNCKRTGPLSEFGETEETTA
jgi:hypothetical protein